MAVLLERFQYLFIDLLLFPLLHNWVTNAPLLRLSADLRKIVHISGHNLIAKYSFAY